MAKHLLGREVAAALEADVSRRCAALREQGTEPKLVLVRCGQREDDIAYEKSILRQAARSSVETEVRQLPEDSSPEEMKKLLRELSGDEKLHGCLIFRPLPEGLGPDRREICNALAPEKDVDGCTAASAAAVYTGEGAGFPPCTAQACLEMLDFYGVDCRGKRAAVIGRSLVVGKPLAMLLTARDATVTLCHSRTEDLGDICRQADIIICAAGKPGLVTGEMVRPGQTVLDVSMNYLPELKNADGSLGGFVGDAVFREVEKTVEAISPVPGGLGRVTSAVLMKHVVAAAERSLE